MTGDRSDQRGQRRPDKPLTPRERQRRDFMRKQRAASQNKSKSHPSRGRDEPERKSKTGPAGYPVRAMAARLVSAVFDRHHAFDDALAAEFATPASREMEPRDRGLARLIASNVLRRKGELDAVLARFIERPLPDDSGLLRPILLCAATQLVHLDIAPHAVLNIAVEQCRHDRGARRFDKLANAVLRRVSEQGRSILPDLQTPEINIPPWNRWVATYGASNARAIAESSLQEAPLDLTLKDQSPANISDWANRLGATELPTGSIRLTSQEGRVDALPGFEEGAWWVQDAAASLPALLMGNVVGQRVVDCCAAPGGKSAQLAARGAHVTALDISPQRLDRARENFHRLGLAVDLVVADIETWRSPEPITHALLDAPCSATGTIRRHPDILYLKRESDIAKLAAIQARMLDRIFSALAPGGTLTYCTCSLEREEGEHQIADFLARTPLARRIPFDAKELHPEIAAWINSEGDIRTLPSHLPAPDSKPGGVDGFFISRISRSH